MHCKTNHNHNHFSFYLILSCLSFLCFPSLYYFIHTCAHVFDVFKLGAWARALQTVQFCHDRLGLAKAKGFQVNITSRGMEAIQLPPPTLTDYLHFTPLSLTHYHLLSLSLSFSLSVTCFLPFFFLFPSLRLCALFSKGSTCPQHNIKVSSAPEFRALPHVKMCRSNVINMLRALNSSSKFEWVHCHSDTYYY